jgi:hypothetical protein
MRNLDESHDSGRVSRNGASMTVKFSGCAIEIAQDKAAQRERT